MIAAVPCPKVHYVDIVLLYFDACPNWRLAAQRLRSVLRELGHEPDTVRLQQVSTPEQADQLSFRGSPTVLIDGVDPFADPAAPVGLSCRVFSTPNGLKGAPTAEQLRQALTAAQG